MNFVCLLMSDSELLRIKNKQKASYKSRKTAKSNLKSSYGLMTDLGLIRISVVSRLLNYHLLAVDDIEALLWSR